MYESKGAPLLCTVNWFAPGKRSRMMIVREFGTFVHTHTDAQRFALYEGMGPRVNGMYLTPLVPVITHPAYEADWPLESELRAFAEAIRKGSCDGFWLQSLEESWS